MEVAIDANAPLDYIEFDIFPSQNRYNACGCYANKKEEVMSGLLEHLLLHSAEIRDLQAVGSDAKYRLSRPGIANDNKWFTKSTLIRFLDIVGPGNILEATDSLRNEISQLEEARRFHLSLYTKAEGSDASKNELLRAMDSRLTALRAELTVAFVQAVGSRYSLTEMTDIEKFSRHIGSEPFSESLHKYIELRQGTQAAEHSKCHQFSESDRVRSEEGNNQTSESFPSETPVRYGVSPAKVAQVERQNSTESDESSLSSEEERPSAERSRTLARSASPRRSASPMRRVQIGRAGSRRATAITIKSLNFVPARERSFMPKDLDATDSDEEGSQQVPKPSENNVRISVQDAINLFESKQRDQKTDIQKARSMLNASIGPSKSVLRRWSSGMGENSSQSPQDASAEDSVTQIQNKIENTEASHNSPKSEHQPDSVLDEYPIEPCGSDDKLNLPEKEELSVIVLQEKTFSTESNDANEKLTASAEWSRQKEAELSELLMKMSETKAVKSRTVVPASNKRQSLPSEQRGISYNHYKEKRDEKLRGEAARKGAEKDKQFKGMQKILDAKKSLPASAKANEANKKHNVKKVQKPQRSLAEPANPKTESPKLGVVKKASPKPSSLPATRKSWPSMPSARAPGLSPAKTPPTTSHSGAVPTRRRSQPTKPVSHSSTKVEKPQSHKNSVKLNTDDSKSSLGSATEKKQQSAMKPRKSAKSKVHTSPEDLTSAAKAGLNSKVTKKSSVVPLELKPSLRRGSRTVSNVNSSVKKKTSSSAQEPLRKSEDLTKDVENVKDSNSSDLVIQNEERKIGETHTDKEHETEVSIPQNPGGDEKFVQVDCANDDGIDSVAGPELKAEDEVESTISPTAWVEEIEEHEDQPVTSREHDCQMVGSPAYAAPVGVSNLRVRHSLSQMLLEESSEPDVVDWGNAEHPPQMVYHKDAPKGLKRLLKFARKTKTEANSVGWSSPSVFSEGEDDTDDSKIVNKRNTENLLRKATLHSKNNGHQNEHSAQASVGNFDVQRLSQQMQEGHVSASVITTKASRSFFSLSAFKGSK